jgi:hypothetical protein
MTDVRPVALMVCSHSRDATDAKEMLEMLGLLDEDGDFTWPKGPPPGLDVRTIKNVASTGMTQGGSIQ